MKNQAIIQFIKFSVVGSLNTIVDFGVFSLLISSGVPMVLSQTLSYSCGIINSFLINRSWTFKVAGGKELSETMKYIVANITTLLLMTFFLVILTNEFHLPILLAKVAVTGIGMVLNFLSSKFWVFQRIENRGYE